MQHAEVLWISAIFLVFEETQAIFQVAPNTFVRSHLKYLHGVSWCGAPGRQPRRPRLFCQTLLFVIILLVLWPWLATPFSSEHVQPLRHVKKQPSSLSQEPDASQQTVLDPGVTGRWDRRASHKSKDSTHAPATLTLILERHHSATMEDGVPHYKSAYLTRVRIGTPAIEFSLVLDTGSGNLIVPSTYCSDGSCRPRKLFSPRKSSTALDVNEDGTVVTVGSARDHVTVAFGTGVVSGVFVDDWLCLSAGSRHCVRTRLIAATHMTDTLDLEFDGVLGLGLGLSQSSAFSMLQALSEHGMSGIFSIFIADGKEASELTLGGWSSSRIKGSLHWHDVLRPDLGHWSVRIRSLRVDDHTVSFCNEGCSAVVDSGTSLLSAPSAVFTDLFEALWHQAPLSGQCEGQGPMLYIELDSVTIVLGPKDYAQLVPVESIQMELVENRAGPPRRHDLACRPLLMEFDWHSVLGSKLFVFGEPILRRYYTVFDADQKRIGFGLARHGRRYSKSFGGPRELSMISDFRQLKASR